MRAIKIPDRLLSEVYRHAREEYPNECCGWLVGPRDGDEVTKVRRAMNAYEGGSHPTAPDRTAETAYVIDGDDLLELNRTLDAPDPPRVIYHSHPNGRAYFSETDRRIAVDPWEGRPVYPVQQLVVGIDAREVVEARLFDWDAASADFVEVAVFGGTRRSERE